MGTGLFFLPHEKLIWRYMVFTWQQRWIGQNVCLHQLEQLDVTSKDTGHECNDILIEDNIILWNIRHLLLNLYILLHGKLTWRSSWSHPERSYRSIQKGPPSQLSFSPPLFHRLWARGERMWNRRWPVHTAINHRHGGSKHSLMVIRKQFYYRGYCV